jgi:hypothetical protein
MYKIKIVINAHITRVITGLSNNVNIATGKDCSEIKGICEYCNQLY